MNALLPSLRVCALRGIWFALLVSLTSPLDALAVATQYFYGDFDVPPGTLEIGALFFDPSNVTGGTLQGSYILESGTFSLRKQV